MKIFNKKTRTCLRLFPYLKNKELGEKLLIDEDSIHFISIREYAEKISDIINIHISMHGLNKENVTITDMTAGVGGDTISFSKKFKFVNAIELDKLRSQYLENNAKIYECNNINIINDDCLNIINNIDDHDVVYMDPPWGGSAYKMYDTLKLNISNEEVEKICLQLMDPNFMKKVPKLIVLKLPKNYDIVYLYKQLNNKNIYYYDLKKMIILVINV